MAKRSVRLSRDVIIDCAMSLADAEGLEAVTVRRLAQENGVTPMAMYWHFNDKDSLLDALSDHLLAAVKLPEADDAPWDVQLRLLFGAVLDALQPHPEVAGLVLRRILLAESGLILAERALELLGRGGFGPDRAAQIGTFLMCSVVALASAEPGPGPTVGAEERDGIMRHKRAMIEALSPARFPTVIAGAPALIGCRDNQDFFALSLDLLVAGVRGTPRD
ncbi:TetR/AcrR family transcriptional regulator [Pseudosporangium ferrugineum]|uniref:TetR family transcriptional regulator n=1 Tax=Pseudosporangium ferrugineum TaxID=439699 RepID=A0A2T0S6H3_9ACTN|nr:TetR family transcriptional regulator [Pseudosporangium ferrugineum]PRY29016.1 TetR family transcriptional regulator [Pseudosporangium ferrugineum]